MHKNIEHRIINTVYNNNNNNNNIDNIIIITTPAAATATATSTIKHNIFKINESHIIQNVQKAFTSHVFFSKFEFYSKHHITCSK